MSDTRACRARHFDETDWRRLRKIKNKIAAFFRRDFPIYRVLQNDDHGHNVASLALQRLHRSIAVVADR